jgi:hypothetical protein
VFHQPQFLKGDCFVPRNDGMHIEPSLRENPDENAPLLERSSRGFRAIFLKIDWRNVQGDCLMPRKNGIRIEPSLRENPDENARLLERSPSGFSWQSS